MNKVYNVTIALGYDEVTVEYDIPVEYTASPAAIYDYIIANVEVDWDEA